MPSLLQKAILQTIIYADVFDYPVDLEEINKWIIGCNNATMQQCRREIKKIKPVEEKDNFYFLKRKEKIVDLRQDREKHSQKKLKITKEIINLLKFIPTVKLIGVTGALAMENAKEDDDMDLFIVSTVGFLWTTRFLTTLFIEFLGMRRRPGEKNVNNKICLNMFSDENHLSVPKQERDLFTAHEVLQMKPLFDRGDTYAKFLFDNEWVKKYLPNALNIKNQKSKIKNTNKKVNVFSLVETVLKKFQLWYMRKKRTTEVIKEGMIRFHPHDAREWVMKSYGQECRKFKLQS